MEKDTKLTIVEKNKSTEIRIQSGFLKGTTYPVIDIRYFKKTDAYTGYTKDGVRMDIKVAKEVYKAFGEAIGHMERWIEEHR